MKYLALWNLIDWAHFASMWAAWTLWLNQINLSNAVALPPGFAILNSFDDNTQARLFLTNPEKEFVMLQFLKHLKMMKENLTNYTVLTCISGESTCLKVYMGLT